MSCKSLIHTALTSPTAVAADGIIPLGSIVRRYGCALAANGNGVNVMQPGCYGIKASITVLPTAAGAITATVLKDGVAIPSATATGTATAAGDAVNLSIVSAPRKCGCGCPDLLTVELSAAGTVDNMALVIERV